MSGTGSYTEDEPSFVQSLKSIVYLEESDNHEVSALILNLKGLLTPPQRLLSGGINALGLPTNLKLVELLLKSTCQARFLQDPKTKRRSVLLGREL